MSTASHLTPELVAEPDPMGLALTESGAAPLLVERTDGHLSTTDLRWWLSVEGSRPPVDFAALDWTRPGTALDIGCSTGRHLTCLGDHGVTAHGIDTCAPAVELARASGTSAEVADVFNYAPPNPVDTVIALGGGLGIAGTKAKVPEFLRLLASWLAPGGSIITSSVDWQATAAQHRSWINAANEDSRHPGDVRVRLRYRDIVGGWFDWTWLDPEALEQSAHACGLTVTRIARFNRSWYAAELTSRAD